MAESFLSPVELAQSMTELHSHYPKYEDFAPNRASYTDLPTWVDFPFPGDALNNIAVHPELLKGMESILGTEMLQLGSASVGAKYAGSPDKDQDLHIDGHGPNSFLYPAQHGEFEQFQIFYYLSDVTDELAPTYVVSWEHTQDESLASPYRTRAEHEWMYELERPVVCPAGTLLIMSMRTFHRGSALRAAAGARFVMALTYHAAAAPWMQHFAWPPATERGTPVQKHLRRFLEQATPPQRQALGFPPPGHPYWTEETLRGLTAWYPGMDTDLYRRGSG